MSAHVQVSDLTRLADEDEMGPRPPASHVNGMYWADLPAARRTQWIWQQQVCFMLAWL